jgi:hypothetical protein
MQFVFMGFSQLASIRRYTFHGLVPKQKNRVFTLSADLTQLNKYRVSIQEGPALCLRILGAAFESAELAPQQFAYDITESDLLTYAAAKDALVAAKLVHRKRRGPFKPSAASQLRGL